MCFDPAIQCVVQKKVRQHRTNHAPYNVAKIPLDFTVSITRIRLKGRYGEGFGGAPLRTPSASPGIAIGDGGERHEQAETDGSTSAGGAGRV